MAVPTWTEVGGFEQREAQIHEVTLETLSWDLFSMEQPESLCPSGRSAVEREAGSRREVLDEQRAALQSESNSCSSTCFEKVVPSFWETVD